MAKEPAAKNRERIWDPLVRLFHWTLAGAFATAWFIRSEAAIHETAGEIVLILIIARAAWGLVGPASARFETFVKGPRATLSYLWSILRGRPARHLGHNPAGAAMIGALLVGLAATTASGVLMTTTALWGNGWIESIHGTAAAACVVLIAGHLLGVVVASLQHKEFLPASMVTGRKPALPETPPYLGPAKLRPLRLLLATIVVLFAASAWYGSTWALNGSLWRMPKIIAAGAKDAGCEQASVSGPRFEAYPGIRLIYEVNANLATAEFAVSGEDFMAKRPTLDFAGLKILCAKPEGATSTTPISGISLPAVSATAAAIAGIENEMAIGISAEPVLPAMQVAASPQTKTPAVSKIKRGSGKKKRKRKGRGKGRH